MFTFCCAMMLLAATAGDDSAQNPPAAVTPVEENLPSPRPTTGTASIMESPATGLEVMLAPGGWHAAVEGNFIKPHYADRVGLPAVALDWTGAPRVMLGYLLPGSQGDITLTYRGLASSGATTVNALDSERSRLDVQTVNLDYLCPEVVPGGAALSPLFRRELVVGFGIGAATLFHDTQMEPQNLPQQSSMSFWGVGPRFLINYTQPLGASPFALYLRGQAEGLYGQQQSSLVSETQNVHVGSTSTGAALVSGECGVAFTPTRLPQFRFAAGYVVEHWWFLSQSIQSTGSQLMLQGIAFRAEYRY
jgi:hypothetical protein